MAARLNASDGLPTFMSLGAGAGQVFQRYLFNLEGQQTRINLSFFPFGTRNGHLKTCLQHSCGITTAYNGWDAQLPRNRGVAVRPRLVRWPFQNRFPVRSVLSVTKTSPSREWSGLFASRITVAFPWPMDSPTLRPVTNTSPLDWVIATRTFLPTGLYRFCGLGQ